MTSKNIGQITKLTLKLFTGEVFVGTPEQIVRQMNETSRFPYADPIHYTVEFARRADFFIKSPIDGYSPVGFIRSIVSACMAEVISSEVV